MKTLTCGFLIATSLFLFPRALAQESSRKWDISVWIAGSTGEELTNSFAEAQLWSAGFSVGRVLTPEIGDGWRRGQLEYAFAIVPILVQSRPHRVYGGGFDPMILRWNSALHVAQARPYVELSGGALRSNTNLPSGNTSMFNFTVKGGGGLKLPVRGGDWLDLGLRWSHISNANLGTQNPEFNGIELRLGFTWTK